MKQSKAAMPRKKKKKKKKSSEQLIVYASEQRGITMLKGIISDKKIGMTCNALMQLQVPTPVRRRLQCLILKSSYCRDNVMAAVIDGLDLNE
jgi:hypothetical protein